jgi:acetoin utilization deacetylase AcuC-like enzyme
VSAGDPRPLIARSTRFREHASETSHPECPERLDAIDRAIAPLEPAFRELELRPAEDAEIARVHDPAHLARLREVAGRHAKLDADTYTSPTSGEVARLAAGSAIELARAVARREAPRGFALLRPPGHHAEATHAMGFCLLNQIAIAAQALRAEEGIERLAIVDIDVHHGNGTQHSFESDRDVLFASLHQFPFYPGTGSLSEQGSGAGTGATLNLPLPAGCGDAEYGAVFDAVLLPALREYRPEMLLISAGFDAHAADPLASMRLSTAAYRRFASQLRTLADETCDGRIAFFLEGGYDLTALGSSVHAVLEVLTAPAAPELAHPAPSALGEQVVSLFREAHGAHWNDLKPKMTPKGGTSS